jgi:hypothetical protein
MINEELRHGIIDAGIVGTPIAKLTHPLFVRDRTTKMRCCGSPRPESSLSLCRNICAMLKIKGPCSHVGLGSFFSVGEAGIK